MEIEISKTVEVMEVHIMFDPDGTPETVVRFVDKYGEIVRMARVANLNDALTLIKKQGE